MSPVIARILVAMDASPRSLTALEGAVVMAEALHAELAGLFVEDVNLLRLAELPLGREVDRFTGRVRALDSAQIERQFRAQAERARRALETAAHRAHLRWTFRVCRGLVAAEVVAAAETADMLTLGATGWVPADAHVGSTVQAVIDRAPCHTLVLGPGARLISAVFAPFDGSESAVRALDAAVRMAIDRDGPLTVFLPPPGQADVSHLHAAMRTCLNERAVRVAYVHARGDAVGMLSALNDTAGGLLVLPADHGVLHDAAFGSLLRGRHAVLIVR